MLFLVTAVSVADAVHQGLIGAAIMGVVLWLLWVVAVIISALPELPKCLSLTYYPCMAFAALLGSLCFVTAYSFGPQCNEGRLLATNVCDRLSLGTPVVLISVTIMLPQLSAPALSTKWMTTVLGSLFYLVVVFASIGHKINPVDIPLWLLTSLGNLALVTYVVWCGGRCPTHVGNAQH